MKKALASEWGKITHKIQKIIREEILTLISKELDDKLHYLIYKALDEKVLVLISKVMDEKLLAILNTLIKKKIAELFVERLHLMLTTKVILLFIYMFILLL